MVLVVGDSISNHYMEALPAALGKAAASVSGGSDWSATDWSEGRGTGCDSTQALAFLRATLVDASPDILLLNCGLHDIKHWVTDTDLLAEAGVNPEHAGRHQVEPAQYADNLTAMVELVQQQHGGKTRLVWVTTTLCDVGSDGTIRTSAAAHPSYSFSSTPFDRSNATIAEYNRCPGRPCRGI